MNNENSSFLKELFFASIIPLLYFFISLFIISDYGVSFDEAPHFRRGQAYLHFFFTGSKDYENIREDARKSYYQSDSENGKVYIETNEQSHPPLNDILAAFTNYVFYQKLGILGDVESHHLFEILSVTFLLIGVYLFTRVNYGIFSAQIAVLSIVLFPLFFAESHFNIKDPPQASFFGLTLISLWAGVIYKKTKFIFLSSLFASLALGTKFNIVFLPFLLLPWLILKRKVVYTFSKSIWISLFLYPFIIFTIFLLSNPNLWTDTVKRIGNMIGFYVGSATKVGGSPDYQPEFLFNGFNMFPIFSILYTTPLVVLFLSFIGFFVSLFLVFKKKDPTSVLILTWFLFPILRVSIPGSTLYGGIRHIFEFVPAFGILSGIGALFVVNTIHIYLMKRYKKFKKNRSLIFLQVLILLSFLPIAFRLISIHPNENVYFNPLIGGLKGAKEKKFPLAGASLGNTYLQGAKWLNKYAGKNSCVATPLAHAGNIPPHVLRKDIEFNNACQSGTSRKGEYVMDMVYSGYFNDWYAWRYYDAYLIPIHEIKVDDVVIFQIYKNSLEFSKKELIKEEIITIYDYIQDANKIKITLPEVLALGIIDFYYDISPDCKPISDGYVVLSVDGENWFREPDNMNVSLGKGIIRPHEKRVERRFAAKKAKYIHLLTNLDNDCRVTISEIKVLHHPDAK